MKLFCLLLLIFGLQISYAVVAAEADINTIFVSTAVNNRAVLIKKMLEDSLPPETPVIYTLVPRGLVVSIEEDVFFQGNSIKLRQSSVVTLNAIIDVLNTIGNNCTIESHTEGHDNPQGDFHSNWEISMARANSITDYLVYCGKISPDRVFALGFGDMMPFKDNVSSLHSGFDRRVDFVIFDYEESR